MRGVPLSTVPRHLLSRQSRSRSSQAFDRGPGGWEIVVRSQGQGSGAGNGLQRSRGGFRPVVRGTFEQFKTRLLRVVGRERLGGEGSIRLRRPPCCPRCLLRARAAVRIAPERRAHEFRPSDYEKGTRHPSINPIGGGEYLRSDRWRRWPGGVSIT